MAEPTEVRPPGAKAGYNARITSPALGSIDIMVTSLTHGTKINSQESSAAQARTFYPQKVSDAPFSVVVAHRSIEDRNRLNRWLRRYMEEVSANKISHGYLTLSVPARRFVRKGVVEGRLGYGDSTTMRGKIYTTNLTFIASTDPAERAEISRVRHSEDWEILKHYPSGMQAGWSTDETLYDRDDDSGGRAPIQRPGMPVRPV